MIIAIAGRKQSGKTSTSEYICHEFTKIKQQISSIYNFADPLKQLCQDILDLKYDQCYGTDDQKNELVDCYWDNKQLSAREVMQLVGTDMFRKLKHNVWANATIKRILDESIPLSVIADCRFPNEVDVVKNAGGIVIKLNRNPHNSIHSSEIALDSDNYDQNNFDLIVNNHDISIEEKNKIIYKFLLDKGVLS